MEHHWIPGGPVIEHIGSGKTKTTALSKDNHKPNSDWLRLLFMDRVVLNLHSILPVINHTFNAVVMLVMIILNQKCNTKPNGFQEKSQWKTTFITGFEIEPSTDFARISQALPTVKRRLGESTLVHAFRRSYLLFNPKIAYFIDTFNPELALDMTMS